MADLLTNFKDDVLDNVNPKRKYNLIHNSDGTVSLEDVSVYSQNGSEYGAKEVNEERAAINKINHDRVIALKDVDLVTEQGFFVDALAVKELNSALKNTNTEIDTLQGKKGLAGTSIRNIYMNTTENLIYGAWAVGFHYYNANVQTAQAAPDNSAGVMLTLNTPTHFLKYAFTNEGKIYFMRQKAEGGIVEQSWKNITTVV